MTIDLPEPRTDHLESSPLSLVVCQVRHERNEAVGDPTRAVAVHERLADRYPQLEDQSSQELTITTGESGVQAGQAVSARGWRMRDSRGEWTVVIMPDFFALETTSYDSWEDFRTRFQAVATAVMDKLHPAVEERIGLRFIDRITHPQVDSPSDWRGLISDGFLGPVADGRLTESVTGTQNVAQLDVGDGRSVIMRFGSTREATPETNWVYILDTDCYVQRGRGQDLERMLGTIETLHTLSLQLFQASVTEELYEFLRTGSQADE